MKLIDTTCPHCGAQLQIDANKNTMFCSHCGTELLIDDEKQHVIYDNAEDAGYQFEKGRQRALAERSRNASRSSSYSKPKKKSNIWLWIIGWIIIFPLPLTILLVKNKKMNLKLKIGIIAATWVVYLLIGLGGYKNSATAGSTVPAESSVHSEIVSSEVNNNQIKSENTEVVSTVPAEYDGSYIIDSFVSSFNDVSDIDLEYVEDFVPSDRNSGHYRTEFRLNAYNEAIGKSYIYDGITIDIVCHANMFKNPSIRLYGDGLSIEQISALIDKCSPLFDANITASDVQTAIDYINEHREANGYYYGDLVLLVLGNDNTGYSLMIKND